MVCSSYPGINAKQNYLSGRNRSPNSCHQLYQAKIEIMKGRFFFPEHYKKWKQKYMKYLHLLKILLLHIIFIEIFICHHLLAPSITASQHYVALQDD